MSGNRVIQDLGDYFRFTDHSSGTRDETGGCSRMDGCPETTGLSKSYRHSGQNQLPYSDSPLLLGTWDIQ
jgi:hypothetical protein